MIKLTHAKKQNFSFLSNDFSLTSVIFGILCASALCENITLLSSVVTSNSLDVSKCTPTIYFPSRPTSKHESMSYSTAENKHSDTLYTNNQHKCLKIMFKCLKRKDSQDIILGKMD